MLPPDLALCLTLASSKIRASNMFSCSKGVRADEFRLYLHMLASLRLGTQIVCSIYS